MSLARDILQISPASTRCSISTRPEAMTTRTVPSDGISNVVGWDPYSSAFWAIRPTLGTLPMVAGSKAPYFWQFSMISL